MAYNIIFFENSHTGAKKEAPVGFSWTSLFFNIFVPLIRGDWKWAILTFIITTFTLGFGVIYFAFAYNKLYIKELVNAGYKAKGVQTGTLDAISTSLGINVPTS